MGLMENLFGGGGGGKQKATIPYKQYSAMYKRALEHMGAPPEAEGMPTYQGFDPESVGFERAKFGSIAPGGWDKFEEAYAATPLRRLMEEKALSQNKFMAQMRKTGMADDPSAYKLWSETGETPYANSMADILSGATAARYPLQLQEQTALNQLGLTQASDLNRLGLQQQTALNQMRQAQSQYGNEFAKWSWGAPRDWWRQKMGVFYGGQPTVTGQTQGTTGGIIPGIGKIASFSFGG